jgi:competence protein ComEC
VLLTGDVEPAGQAVLSSRDLGVVDVLKVPHHGSGYQDERLLGELQARLALVSVGADNDYGHPDADVLSLLRRTGATVRRTDEHGDVAVVVRDGTLRVVTAR